VLADFPTVDEKAESISGTVSLGVNPGTTDGWAWGINKCRDGDRATGDASVARTESAGHMHVRITAP